MANEGCYIGIDLGTTYSCVAVWRPPAASFSSRGESPGSAGSIETLVNDLGKKTTPSVVAFEDSSVLVGANAKKKHGRNTIYAVKRIIGLTFNDPAVEEHKRYYQYEIVDSDGKAACCVEQQRERRIYSPEEISSYIIKMMREIVEKQTGSKVAYAVVTVPAFFSNAQRDATKRAAALGGLDQNKVTIINEPTAAAIAHGVNLRNAGDKQRRTVFVYDLGGGTFDVTIMSIDGLNFDTICHNGSQRLGGEDFDMRIEEYLLRKFAEEYGGDVSIGRKSLLRLRREIEEAKMDLVRYTEAEISVDMFHEGQDFYYNLTRAEFENECEDIFQRTIQIVNQTLTSQSLTVRDIDEVLLVGGSSQILRVRELLRNLFYDTPVMGNINVSEAIAAGATLHAATLASPIEPAPDIPDLIVLNEVTTFPLGLKVGINNAMSVLIPAGERLPKEATKTYTNIFPGNAVTLCVYQGTEAYVSGCSYVDEFRIESENFVDAGVLRVKVTFKLAADGILTVSAVEERTATEAEVRITRMTW